MKLKTNERIDQLYSQGVKIIQNPDVFSFSLDAILLSYFAKLPRNKSAKIVDLCSGNGAVGLFMHNKTNGKIIELELQSKLVDMAKRSIKINNLENKISVYHGDLNDSYKMLGKDSIDVVTCNPPYFKDIKTSKKNPNEYLAIARHEIKTDLMQVLSKTSGLLKMHGKAFFVYRPNRLTEMLILMKKNRLAPKRIQFVYPRRYDNANIVLIEAIKDGKIKGLSILPSLVTFEDKSQKYTNELNKIIYG